MFNFVRESPHEQGVDCIRRIDSKGHLCGEAFSPLTCPSPCLHTQRRLQTLSESPHADYHGHMQGTAELSLMD